MKEQVLIVGGGGHAKVVIDALNEQSCFCAYGVLDGNLKNGTDVLGVKVLGDDTLLEQIYSQGVKKAFIAIGSIGNTDTRVRVYDRLKSIGYELPYISHPRAYVAKDVAIGEGSFVGAGAVINPGTKIGKNVIINTRVVVEHDCVIGDFTHIAPGAVIGGNVNIKEHVHVGIGAIVIQGVVVAQNTFIKARDLVK